MRDPQSSVFPTFAPSSVVTLPAATEATMNARKLTTAFAAGLAAAGLIAGALTAPLAGAATVASDSQSYTPGGDFVTYCSGSTGVGGGCFAPAATATTVQASLKD